MNFKEAHERIWESLQGVTVATLISLSKGEGKVELWYDCTDGTFMLGCYEIYHKSAEEALEWYSENIDSEFAIDIKEL